MQCVCYFCPDLIKIGICLQILLKSLKYETLEKPRPVGVSFCAQG